ncbi:hypothetical protein AMTR_s00090p00119800 [Amborella trichopoda]|uniref:Metallo-beta-lactamase domain-containing protein n=1 Tax=Amborella trichopoda TaxID=13333 RepID=W1NVL4_AMBTC|nr:hypothetical protein AMTR_s00090p00119800 [Amborella trichopoda]
MFSPSPFSCSYLPFPAIHHEPAKTELFFGQKFGRDSSDSGQNGTGPSSLAMRRSGFLSTVNSVIEEEECRKARAEVNRKGEEVENVLIKGVSVGGHETCAVVPSMNVAFDIGRCPAKAVHQDFLFITHAHLDHIVSLLIVLL